MKYSLKTSRFILAVLASLPFVANAAITLTSTADSKPLAVPAESFDTPAAKEFLKSGKNTYLGNTDAIKAGKKVFQLYSCTACHGARGEGAVGPNLIDDKWNYAKNVNDQGIFETIWGGTAGGMGAKGKGLMQADDPSQGLTADEVLKVVAFIRSNAIGAEKPAEAVPAKATTTEAPKADAAATAATVATGAAAAVATTSKATKSVKKKAKKAVKAKVAN